MGFSDYLEKLVLNKILRNENFTISSVYLSLHSDDPGETGASEVSGAGYVRQLATFNAASGLGESKNSDIIIFDDMPEASISHAGAWDSQSGGNFLFGGQLNKIGTFALGATVEIGAGEISVTLD